MLKNGLHIFQELKHDAKLKMKDHRHYNRVVFESVELYHDIVDIQKYMKYYKEYNNKRYYMYGGKTKK